MSNPRELLSIHVTVSLLDHDFLNLKRGKNMKNIVVLIAWVMLLQVANAGTGSGKILQITAHSSGDGAGVVMFKTENNQDKAACSTTDGGSQWAISLSNNQGKAMYALLLSAQAQQKSINVKGAGECSAWPARE
ncbi:MAG: hypothetical protein P8Y45_03215, partial [Exilibacterium sp.]